jgi:hypothetical protein
MQFSKEKAVNHIVRILYKIFEVDHLFIIYTSSIERQMRS